jgi:MFS family permease
MQIPNLKSLLFLTLGWFGIEMALALDATQFQVLLDQQLDQAGIQSLSWNVGNLQIPFGKATLIGLVLSFGPLAGITVQPFMGWLGDRLLKHGIDRRFIIKQGVFYSLVCTVLFTLKLSLWALIIAIALFFISFNVLNVSYRAWITETSNRRALVSQKGLVSGFIALFSGFGGFCMFMLFKFMGNSPWPAACSAIILLLCFILVFRYAPVPKQHSADKINLQESNTKTAGLLSPWHGLFYALPVVGLIPAIERRLIHQPEQKPIFRLFLTIFFAWLGIQALRGFFVLLATKDLHVSYEDANLALAVLTLVMVGAALPLGSLADRLDNRRLLFLSLLGFAVVCLASYWVADSLPGILIMSICLGLSFAGMIVMPLSLLLKWCPKQSEGVYSGLYNLFISLPQLYSLFLTGWLVDVFQSYRIILMVGAVTVACAVLLCLRLNEKDCKAIVAGSKN